MPLPKEIQERPPSPHALTVWTRREGLPEAGEIARFCGLERAGAGEGWFRAAAPPESLLVFLPEAPEPVVPGFAHAVVVESGTSRLCFLAAYFAARRGGGVVWIQKRVQAYAAAQFGEVYLSDGDLEARWARALG